MIKKKIKKTKVHHQKTHTSSLELLELISEERICLNLITELSPTVLWELSLPIMMLVYSPASIISSGLYSKRKMEVDRDFFFK